MTVSLSGSEPASIDAVVKRLSEPQTVAALNTLLDHADLLAIAVVALDGFIGRTEVIGEALTSGIDELRSVASANGKPESLDPGQVLASALELGAALPKITPALTRMCESGLIDTVVDSGIASPVMVEQISKIGSGLSAAAEADKANPIKVPGAFGLLKLLKDPDINRGAGFFLAALKAIGAELSATDKSSH